MTPEPLTVPVAAEAIQAYYRLPHRGLGGCVHIILEDSNVDQGSADWCLHNARQWGDNWGDGYRWEDHAIAFMLASMSRTQRLKLAHMSFYPDEALRAPAGSHRFLPGLGT